MWHLKKLNGWILKRRATPKYRISPLLPHGQIRNGSPIFPSNETSEDLGIAGRKVLQSLFPGASNPQPHCSFCCLFLFGWMGDRATFDVLFYLMISWMYTCRALGPWCMFYATRRQVYWVLTRNVVFCWYSNLTSHTQTHTAYSGASRLTYVNIYLHQLLCARSSYLYYIEWIIHWYQKFTFHNVFFSKIIHLIKPHLLIRCL